MCIRDRDKVYQKMWDNTGSPKWKASSTMTPNKVVSQFDPAIILSGSKAIKNDMKLKKSGSVYRVSYSGSSLRFWNKTHKKLIKKLKDVYKRQVLFFKLSYCYHLKTIIIKL